jgi:hypothetical protein
VIAMDNFFTSQKSNVKDLIGLPNFELVRHDVTEPYYAEVRFLMQSSAMKYLHEVSLFVGGLDFQSCVPCLPSALPI